MDLPGGAAVTTSRRARLQGCVTRDLRAKARSLADPKSSWEPLSLLSPSFPKEGEWRTESGFLLQSAAASFP